MKNNNIFKKYINLLNVFGLEHKRCIEAIPVKRGLQIFFEYSCARFQCGGILLYVAPLLDLFLNYSLQSMICWMR